MAIIATIVANTVKIMVMVKSMIMVQIMVMVKKVVVVKMTMIMMSSVQRCTWTTSWPSQLIQ